MLNAKLNSGAMDSVPENGGKVNAFEQVKRDFETAHASGGDYTPQLLNLSTAIARSVVRKCLDPQRKTAGEQYKVSDNGINPAIDDLRRGIAADVHLLDLTAANADKATKTTFDENGDFVTVTADKDAENALNALIGETLSDGIDLVNAAALAILEQAAAHAAAAGWLDAPYTTRRLSKRVYIRASDSAAYADVETTPIAKLRLRWRPLLQLQRPDSHQGSAERPSTHLVPKRRKAAQGSDYL